MYQYYKLIFLAKAVGLSRQGMISVIKNVVSEAGKLCDNDLVLYEPAFSKSACKQIEITDDYLLKQLNKKSRRTDLEMDLPCQMNFFSSFDDEECLALSFGLGGANNRFSDTIIINLPVSVCADESKFKGICDCFKKIILYFNPYYAFMANNLNESLSEKHWEDKPTYVHTLNYFGEDTAKKIGIEKLRKLQSAEEADGGWYLKLLDEPLDVDNPLHLEKQKQISEFLGLID